MKKRRKKRAEGEAGAGKPTASKGLAKMGAGAGASTAGSPLKLSQGGSGPTVAPASEPRPPKPEMPPYNMSAEVAAAIAHLRALAAAEPPPPAAAAAPAGGDGDGDGKARKSLPAPIIDYLKSVEKIFHKECAGHKMACRTIVGELMSFLSDYSKKENLRLYVAGRVSNKPCLLISYFTVEHAAQRLLAGLFHLLR